MRIDFWHIGERKDFAAKENNEPYAMWRGTGGKPDMPREMILRGHRVFAQRGVRPGVHAELHARLWTER